VCTQYKYDIRWTVGTTPEGPHTIKGEPFYLRPGFTRHMTRTDTSPFNHVFTLVPTHFYPQAVILHLIVNIEMKTIVFSLFECEVYPGL